MVRSLSAKRRRWSLAGNPSSFGRSRFINLKANGHRPASLEGPARQWVGMPAVGDRNGFAPSNAIIVHGFSVGEFWDSRHMLTGKIRTMTDHVSGV